MAYDAKDGYLVLFGPSASSPLGVTWTYRSGNWTQLNLTTAPSNRSGAMMTYDPAAASVILFGGVVNAQGSVTTFPNDTWSFTGGAWTNVTQLSTHAPVGRWGGAFSWDAVANAVILFGGVNYSTASDTWEYSAGNWTELFPAVSPPNGASGPMAYDEAAGYLVLFGGRNVVCGPNMDCNQTWIFSNSSGNWTELNLSVSPSARAFDAIAYDNATSKIELFGGYCDSQPYLFGDFWEFSNGSWTQVQTNGTPPPMGYGAMAFDPSTNETILVGGSNLTSKLDTSWALGPAANWTQLAPRVVGLFPTIDVNATTIFHTSASPGPGGWTYDYVKLPPGCTGLSVATLKCTPTRPGQYAVSVVVADPSGGSGRAAASVLVNASPRVSVVSATPEDVPLGHDAYFNLSIQNGTPPFAISFEGLPRGCSTSNVTRLSCEPAVVGNFTVTAMLSDRFGESDRATIALTVAPASTGGSGGGGPRGVGPTHPSGKGPGLAPTLPLGSVGSDSLTLAVSVLVLGIVAGTIGSELAVRRRRSLEESRRLREQLDLGPPTVQSPNSAPRGGPR
jgi:hypothetical protein